MRRIPRRLIPGLIPVVLLFACKGDPGPPRSVELRGGSENPDGKGTLELYMGSGEGGRDGKFEGGTVTYTVYAGRPEDGKVRCTMTAPLSPDQLDEESRMHVVPIEFAADCEPLADGVPTFGVVELELSDGTRPRSDADRSYVPKSLGGSGEFEFVQNVMHGRKQADQAGGDQAWLDRLSALAKVQATDAPPLGTPCEPPPVSQGLLVRADQRVLGWLADGAKGALPIPKELFLGTNGYQMQAVAEHFGPDGRTPPKQEAFAKVVAQPVDFVELVVVEQFEAPTIVDAGATDREGEYRPGIVKGEVWIVDVESQKVLCRNAVAATDIQDAKGDQFDTSADKLAQQFAGSVARAVTDASAQIAPGLRSKQGR